MSETHPHRTSITKPAEDGKHDWWHGRSGLLLALIMAAFSTYLLIGINTMQVPEGADPPGPRFFPTLVMVAGFILAVLLAVSYIRTPKPAEPAAFAEDDDASPEERNAAEVAARTTYRTFSDWYAVGWTAGGFLVFALFIVQLGWILAGALLFWCVAHGIGSRRHLFDISLGLVLSSFIYLAFDVGLGLNLPSGLLRGLF